MNIKTFTGILRAFLVPDSCLPGLIERSASFLNVQVIPRYIYDFSPLRDRFLLRLYGHVKRINPIQMDRLAFPGADASDGAIQGAVPLSRRGVSIMGQVRVHSRM